MRFAVALVFLIVVGGCSGRPDSPGDARKLVEEMHSRYDGRWYDTVTFTQLTIEYRGERADTSIWYEALAVPGRLRIDIAPTESGNGLLFADDKRYIYRSDTLLFERDEINPLLVLGFDVYAQDPAVTLSKLDSLGFELEVMDVAEWEGRPAYVVGAKAGDPRSRQFWIDKEHLYLVRVIQPGGHRNMRTVDVRFRDYEPLAEGWIAPTVEFYVDGELSMLERYTDVVAGADLSGDLFDPKAWAAVAHWADPATPEEDAGP